MRHLGALPQADSQALPARLQNPELTLSQKIRIKLQNPDLLELCHLVPKEVVQLGEAEGTKTACKPCCATWTAVLLSLAPHWVGSSWTSWPVPISSRLQHSRHGHSRRGRPWARVGKAQP